MEPFIGMIVMFGGNFAPRDWALCNGQLLQIAQKVGTETAKDTMAVEWAKLIRLLLGQHA